MRRNLSEEFGKFALVALVLCVLGAKAAPAQDPAAPGEIQASVGVAEAPGDDAAAPAPESPAEPDTIPRFDPAERLAKLPPQRPEPVRISPHALVPPFLHVKKEQTRARIFELLPNHEAAQRIYEHCVGMGFENHAIWQGLGRTRLANGDFDGAEYAFLSAQQYARMDAQAGDLESIDDEANALAGLARVYIVTRRPELAMAAMELALSRAPSMRGGSMLLERARFESQGLVEVPLYESQSLWPVAPLARQRASIESLLHRTGELLPARGRALLSRIDRLALNPRVRDFAYATIAFLLIAIVAMRRFKGHGDLVVAIEFPPELRGCFAVHLENKPRQHRRTAARERSAGTRRNPLSSRKVHQMVSRETQFRRLTPRIYFVIVDGVLQDPENEDVLMTPYDEQAVEVLSGQTTRIEFDLRPKECPVDVHVLWDKQPANDAAVSARGAPQSLRVTKEGSTRLRLPKGQHTIVVGSGDRVAEREIDVQSFQPTSIEIDLAGTEGVVFKGCPPAVDAYLHGDLNAAARALSRDGHVQIANLLLARLHRDQGQDERAADYFHAAGHALEAAELRASLKDYIGAAVLFQEAGDAVRSAQMFRAAGEWIRAGEAFESIRDYDNAAECYRESGNSSLWLDALEKKGAHFEAAQIALEQSDRARAIRLLQQVGINDRLYGEACELLADAFEHEGHADLAVQKLEQRIGAGGGSPDLYFRFADLLENAEDLDRALEVFQQLRDEEPTYPDVATRIEGLRKKITARKLADSKGARTGGSNSTPTAFLSERRYELLSELGRGGMGVVFRARDLRLDREVALKRLPDNLKDHPKAIQLFLREAQACARLNHRNIVTIYDTDQEDGNFFITMELLTGYPLNVIRRKKGRLAERDVVKLGMQVAEGLKYAHSHQIVHRDIKTANLFFTNDKVVKIMDFGLAKMMEEVRRGTTVMGGTPYYMAPEQAAGGVVDNRADLYALGVTLFELVTGKVPFDDGDVAYHHRHTPAPDPRERVDDISDPMAELILHMMEKNPKQRCPSAELVLQKLRALDRAPG